MWPMVPFMVADFVSDATEKVIGYYIGILTSSFFFAQVASSLPWGWISDRYGRRPVLLWCTAGSIFAFFGFGFAPSFWFAVLCRTISGSFDATNGIIKAYVGEITDSTNQAKGFALLSLVYGSSAVIAPMFGGLLLNYWPSHPYAAPVVLGGFIGIAAFICSYFFLPESPAFEQKQQAASKGTLDSPQVQLRIVKKKSKFQFEKGKFEMLSAKEDESSKTTRAASDGAGEPVSPRSFSDDDEEGSLIEEDLTPSSRTERNLSLMTALKNKEVLLSTSLYGLLAFAFVIYDELLPVLGRAAIKDGGLGFTSQQVGYLLGFQGCTMVVF